MPTTTTEIPRLLPRALKSTFNAAMAIKSTIEHINAVCEDDEEHPLEHFSLPILL